MGSGGQVHAGEVRLNALGIGHWHERDFSAGPNLGDELEGIAARSDFDLSQHARFSGKSQSVLDDDLRAAWPKLPKEKQDTAADLTIEEVKAIIEEVKANPPKRVPRKKKGS